MPVFTKDDQKILYVHVPKTAGSSVLNLFKDNGYEISYFDEGSVRPFKGLCGSQHIHTELIKEEFDLSEFSYIFSIYRDPVDRLISEYTWRCSKGGQRYPSLKYWVELIFDLYDQDNYVNDNHIRPQNEFYFDECDVYDFNSISSLPKKLSEKINLNISKELGYTNSSKYKYELTDRCKNIIMEFYNSDYNWLNTNSII